MNYCINLFAFALLATATQFAYGQTDSDKAVYAANYGKVMAFVKQPYLHYTTVTTMKSVPVFESKDTATLAGEFFKYLDNFYSNNGLEEIYVQDTVLVRINHERKTIWISRVDRDAKKTLDLLPSGSSDIKERLLKTYTITELVLPDNLIRIDFAANQNTDSKATTTSIWLEYNSKNFLPTTLQIMAKMQQPAEPEILAELEKNQIDSRALIIVKDSSRLLVRTQQLKVEFKNINYGEAVAGKMPSWKTVLDYDAGNNQFIATAAYSEYEVTPTF